MLSLILVTLLVAGDPEAAPSATSLPSSMAAWRLPTMGGVQFWADRRWHAGYRVQHNPVLKIYRLLDPSDQLVVLGTREMCLARLKAEVGDQPACPRDVEVVILLHGLLGFRQAMSGLGDYLHEEGGYTIVNLSYPSTQGDVATHAACLNEVIEHLQAAGCGRIHLVAHSLGNLVVRRYFFALDERGERDEVPVRFGRMVMLGPPNLGSQFAESRGMDLIAQLVGGPPARQLAWEWENLERELATPPLEFGILAGGVGNLVGFNPLLPGDDDGVVAVSETRLPGATDFALIGINHSGMMLHTGVREYTLRFLQEGRFRADGPAEPIAIDVAQAEARGAEGPAR